MGKQNDQKLTVHFSETAIQAKLCDYLIYLLNRQEGFNIRPMVILCIGSDRYTGDALGPLIGSYLEEHIDCIVYGTLESPVHAGNLVETVNLIQYQYHHPIVVAIDACLGRTNEVGNIEMWEGGIEAGIAVGNRLPCVGSISVIGVVNAGGQLGYLDLQSTPLSIVIKLSKIIGNVLIEAIKIIRRKTEIRTSSG
ncbi:spore yyac: putative sporulation protein yyac [Lucifera butyrica]|uniref:Spore yyac: putative sporulation protein yyac n=1 Tax=Lucifera butyrica TaxID=1351585 RepID=A0A498RFL6_9FIRM|nr:spore protease YyaC [Lucifera butyrica]VBB07888.1 spore yyac: putative sporulation protein yyac [Lucifera butyrica]